MVDRVLTVEEVGASPRTSPRITALRDCIMARGGSFPQNENPYARTVALWKAAMPDHSEGSPSWRRGDQPSRMQVRARYLHHLVRLAAIEIEPGWHLVGNHLPTAHLGIPIPDPADEDAVDALAALGVARSEIDDVIETVARWQRSDWLSTLGESDPDLALGGASGGQWMGPVFPAIGWMENHSIRDYAKVLRIGFRGIQQEIEARFAQADPADPAFPTQENFWRAGLAICEAGICLSERYAEVAREMASRTRRPEEAARLEHIAKVCDRVPAEGTRTFEEALQALWFAHILTCGEDGINANSLGQLDQILYPHYQANLAAGRLSPSQARELMEEIACRLYLDYDVQAITLGGADRDGNDATNELSVLILEATRNVDFVRDLSIRLTPTTPTAFLHLAGELIARGGGIPFLFNDAAFVKALTERGIAPEDARDYAPIGCVELTIPGKANPHAVSGHFSSAKCLELALFDGRDPRTDEQLGPQTGHLTDFASFEDLYEAYSRQVAYFARRMVYHVNRGELVQRERGPQPCWSVLTDDCIARGRNITDGGAVYTYHSICFIGTANTADSLMALKKLVFEQKKVAASTVLDALRHNYEGYEPLRQQLLHAPKYGNDIREVDALAASVAEDFIAVMDAMRSPLGGRYFVHLFSFRWNLDYGAHVGATPDGRRAGDPLAYSLSAQQGRDIEGITALLSSLSRLPHDQAAGGSAAIVELDPVVVQGDEGVERLCQLITTAMQIGVGQLQWNVVTAERLLKAQEDPECYGNIPVRVAGYSQMFRLIPRELQDHIIARTKHRR
ncbi:MAG: hypothetical protein JXC32_12710 [Anaerolineae bacterium]|nr:hypothetical protein [Anaerolineae bacterium]